MAAGLQGLSRGFSQGFGMMSQYLGNQEDRKFRQEQAEKQDERWAKQDDRWERQFETSRADRKDDVAHRDRLIDISRADRADDVAHRDNQASESARRFNATFGLQQSQFLANNQRSIAQHEAQMQEFARLQDTWTREDQQRNTKAAIDALERVEQGSLSPEDAMPFLDAAGLPLASYDPQTGVMPQAVEFAKKALETGDFSSPDLMPVFNVLFAGEIKQGLGETYTDDAGTWTIEDKIASHLIPGEKEGEMFAEVRVFERNEKGEERWRDEPMTDGHSVKDNMLLPIPVDQIIEKVQGQSVVSRALNDSPRLQALLKTKLAQAGGDLSEGRYSEMQEVEGLGRGQFGPDGQWTPASAGEGVRAGGLKDSDMRAIYNLHRKRVIEGVNPSGDAALGAMIEQHGGFAGWSDAYNKANEFPDYLTWREQIFGVSDPTPKERPVDMRGQVGPGLSSLGRRESLPGNVQSAITPRAQKNEPQAPNPQPAQGGADALLRQAQEVIDQGAPPQAVRQRLIEMGVPADQIPF